MFLRGWGASDQPEPAFREAQPGGAVRFGLFGPHLRAATKTIPIVAVFIGDPVANGYVASLNRPGGNVTGVSNLNAVIESKRLSLLREIKPQATAFSALLKPDEPYVICSAKRNRGSRTERGAARAVLESQYGCGPRYCISVDGPKADTGSGALMSYGVDLYDTYRLVGVYAARVILGEKPANLPVVQPTKFQFVINMKTAKVLSLAIPSGVLAIADEVIK